MTSMAFSDLPSETSMSIELSTSGLARDSHGFFLACCW